MTPFLLVQALLLSSAASAAYLGGASIYSCPGSTLADDFVDISCQPASDPDNENNSPSSPPLLALSLLSAWPRRATSCVGHSLPLFKQPPSRTHLGHATGPSAVMTPFSLVQVSYLPCARCVCSSDRMLIAVSCPTDTFYATRKLLYQSLSSFCVNAHLTLLLLALSGDVELNPGPDNATPTPVTLEFIASTLSRLEISQNTVLSELAIIRAAQSSIENQVGRLFTRVDELEKIVEAIKPRPPISDPSSKPEIIRLSSQLKNLAQKCDDSENRLRRDNLLFFGIEDVRDETWEISESRVISLCAQKLDIPITKEDIERAHRLGRFQDGKNRPIIVKLARFKVKGSILSAGAKLKGSQISIREDFSSGVRLARKKLYAYAKQSDFSSFKMRFDKLQMNGKQFCYDAQSDSVLEVKS